MLTPARLMLIHYARDAMMISAMIHISMLTRCRCRNIITIMIALLMPVMARTLMLHTRYYRCARYI